jgi:hypothetical protein
MPVTKGFERLADLIETLHDRAVRTVTVMRNVATATSPGGDQIAFRGRLVVSADLGAEERAEYVEHVMPYVASTKSPQIAATPERAVDLRAAQLSLARQLRAYRGEYQGVVEAARARLLAKLRDAGIAAVEPDD